jgi:hypothetical protein
MSNQYSFSLVTKQRKDAEKLLARAEEELKELDPDGNSGVKFNLIEDDTIFGIGDGSLVPRQAELAFKVINAVVASFPEMTMHYYETCNGPLCRAAVSRNGELEEIELWQVVVHIQSIEDYQQVLACLQKKHDVELEVHPESLSIEWSFDAKTEDDVTTEHLNELSRQFPEMLFQCYKYDVCDEEASDEVKYYAQFRGHEVRWEESSLTLLALMRWHRDMDVTYADVLFNTEEVFQTALTKARADEGWYPRIVAEYLFYARSLHSLQPEDYGWLKELAENNIVPACCLLLLGMDRKTRDWEETFIDEDTGEEVKVLREEIIDGTLFEPDDKLKEQLVQTIYDKAEIHYLGIDEIRIACCYPLNATPLRLALINVGEESEAQYIDDPATLQELCDKGNKYAAYALYRKCMWGDEENGIFINKREAKHYFDLAGDVPQQYEEEWDDVDDPGEECPEEFRYTLTGNAETLGAVETLINDLCQQYGTPGNELGLYVPQQILMKMLVGSDSIYYRGNVISMERQAPDTLVITTEADKGEPLLYALRECFENLTVEMKE